MDLIPPHYPPHTLLDSMELLPLQAGDHTSTGTGGVTTSDGAGGIEPHLTIWGTDVNVQRTKKKFKLFLENFVDDFPDGGESPMTGATPYYLSRLDEVRVHDQIWSHLFSFPRSCAPIFFLLSFSLLSSLQ